MSRRSTAAFQQPAAEKLMVSQLQIQISHCRTVSYKHATLFPRNIVPLALATRRRSPAQSLPRRWVRIQVECCRQWDAWPRRQASRWAR